MSNWAKLQEDTIGLPVFKRAKHGIHFDKGNGEILANFSGKPAHFQDTDGLWKPIDTKLLPLGDGYYGCPHSKVKVHPAGHVAVAGTDYIQRVTLPSAQAGLLDGDKLVRKFSFGEQRMWVTEDGFKSEIQLNRIPTLTEAKKLIASESGTLSKEYLKSLTTATDAKGSVHTYSTLTAFRTWLNTAEFPIIIDPDFSASSAAQGMWSNGATSYDASRTAPFAGSLNPAYFGVGQYMDGSNYRQMRGWVKFDTSSIGAGSTITQVNMKLACYYNNNSLKTRVMGISWASYDPLTTSNCNTAWGLFAGETAQDGYFETWQEAAYKTSGNLTTSWVSKTGSTYYGFMCEEDYIGGDTGVGFKRWYVDGSAYPPVLTVTYTAGASGNPHYYYAQQ